MDAPAWLMVARLRARGLPLEAGFDTFDMGARVAVRVRREDGRVRATTFTVGDQLEEVEARLWRDVRDTRPAAVYRPRIASR